MSVFMIEGKAIKDIYGEDCLPEGIWDIRIYIDNKIHYCEVVTPMMLVPTRVSGWVGDITTVRHRKGGGSDIVFLHKDHISGCVKDAIRTGIELQNHAHGEYCSVDLTTFAEGNLALFEVALNAVNIAADITEDMVYD
jgi:hypothetical protein